MNALFPNSIYIQPSFLNAGSVQHVHPEASEQLEQRIKATLQDPNLQAYYQVFDHENLYVGYSK